MSVIRVPIELRWGDQDAYGHINNVAILRVLEEARARAFWRAADSPAGAGIFPPLEPSQQIWALVADFKLRYRGQLPYQRRPVTVELKISQVGGASFVIEYALKADEDDAAPLVTACSTLVMVDRDTGKPQRLSAELREQLRQYSG
ncbi:acyl-CoA thioesterase [Nesterenkonia muleiensis]|uniref:acyl-CoA thioesterase n=1 Tax=Nesterenkonia muleiensis TaxID=2282648 RepID=UPI00130075A1|nr:thioesterase family protein [Nesterenkonia muleiensis]